MGKPFKQTSSLRPICLNTDFAAQMAEAPKWYDAYPKPRNTNPKAVSAKELLALFQAGATAGVDFLLIDLRRVDHEGGTIRGSINLPAQSLYPSLRPKDRQHLRLNQLPHPTNLHLHP